MKFNVLGLKRRGVNYEYIIESDEPWGFTDMLPYMLKVSKRSRDYALMADFTIVYKGAEDCVKAKMTLESTLVPTIKKLHVFDEGIGKQMIEKFVRSVEKED